MAKATSPVYLYKFMEETDWSNGIVFHPIIPNGVWKRLPRPIQSWLRNFIGGTAIYFISCFLQCFYIYYWKRSVYIPKDAIPSNKAMILQIIVAMKDMPSYCCLPTFSEYMIESGWTGCFSRIGEVGWLAFVVYLVIYLVLVGVWHTLDAQRVA